MTLEAAHQLALNKLVELLQTLTDPAEIRRVATAILRVKPPKDPSNTCRATTTEDSSGRASASPEPLEPLSAASPSCLRASVPAGSSLTPKSSFPDDLPLEQLELFRTAFIKRNPARAEEFRAMTQDQFRTHLRDITAAARAHLAQHPPPPDDDD